MESRDMCPYCGGKMKLGLIYQDRYPLKWIPEETDKGLFLQWLSKGIKLTDSFISGSVEAFYCDECEKIIIDVENKNDEKS